MDLDGELGGNGNSGKIPSWEWGSREILGWAKRYFRLEEKNLDWELGKNGNLGKIPSRQSPGMGFKGNFGMGERGIWKILDFLSGFLWLSQGLGVGGDGGATAPLEFWDELSLAGLGLSRPSLNPAQGIPIRENLGIQFFPQIPEVRAGPDQFLPSGISVSVFPWALPLGRGKIQGKTNPGVGILWDGIVGMWGWEVRNWRSQSWEAPGSEFRRIQENSGEFKENSRRIQENSRKIQENPGEFRILGEKSEFSSVAELGISWAGILGSLGDPLDLETLWNQIPLGMWGNFGIIWSLIPLRLWRNFGIIWSWIPLGL